MPVDIDKLRRECDAKIAEATRANEVEAMLPMPPRHPVTIQHYGPPWASYTVDSLQAAVNMLPLFKILPYCHAVNDSFSAFGLPDEIERRDARENWNHVYSIDGAPHIESYVSSGEYSSRYSELCFFAGLADGSAVRVDIRMPAYPIGVRNTPVHSGYGGPARTFRKEYPTVPGAHTIAKSTGSGSVTQGVYWFNSFDTFWASMGTYDVVRPEGV